ncbi:major royal jelly protein 1 isoform X2 [Agrilus planipennis]|uniref:Major royal jelly protein 1 isoform X2 n=1 Tax=Agrilus planipennis TaxID=224129 RepID=A0A1W4WK29_AGRPL|nr:major royal jelly protein 1 isoform X2 [Agrilus planipennis]
MPLTTAKSIVYLLHAGSKWLCVMLGVCTSTWTPSGSIPSHTGGGISEVFQWSQLEFDYPSERDRQQDIASGIFEPGHPTPIDVDVYYGPREELNKVFITIPRAQKGIPVTLGTITKKYSTDGNPIIKPYPSWKWQRNPHRCQRDRIVSVYRIQIDECGRLWVLDTGRIEDDQICLAQILAFDLQTDTLLYRYEIPSSQLEDRSILVTPIVDVRDDKCKDTFVYVADCQTFSIIVYNPRLGVSWKATDKTMYPYPNFGTYDIQGNSFDLMDGVLGMALSPYKPGSDRKLFYHAMSSGTENFVYTSDIRNHTRFYSDPESSPEIFSVYKGTRPSQSAAEAIDKDGIAYFGLMHETTLNCWNTATEYGPENIDTISYNPKTLQFISGIKVITNPLLGYQELWFISNRFQKVATDTLSTYEINFRIQTARVDDVLKGTKCKTWSSSNYYPSTTVQGSYGLYKPRGSSKSLPLRVNNQNGDSLVFVN